MYIYTHIYNIHMYIIYLCICIYIQRLVFRFIYREKYVWIRHNTYVRSEYSTFQLLFNLTDVERHLLFCQIVPP